MGRQPPVFDYSFDTPWLVTGESEAAMERAEAAGESVADAYVRAEVEQLRTDPHVPERYRDVFREAGVDVLSVTLGTRIDPSLPFDERVWRDLARWQARFDAVDWLRKVTSPAEARAAAERDEVGIVLNTQNLGAFVGDDVSLVDELYDAGTRIMQLTYNRQNSLATGCTDHSGGGLSARGRAAVDRVDELGAVVDLSHCNRETTLDAIEHADGPVAFTHVSCGALADHDRAKSDEELRALAAADGYVGIVAIPSFLAPGETGPPLDAFFEHVAHAVSVVGADRVGIGTDCLNLDVDVPDRMLPEIRGRAADNLFRDEHRATDGLGTGFGPFRSYTDWDVLREGIRERYPAAEAEGILGGNFVRFWERVTS